MNQSLISTLQFSAYKIKKFVFTLNDNFKTDKQAEFNVHFANEIIKNDDNRFSVLLDCSVNGKEFQNNDNNIPFVVNIVIEGIFETDRFDDRLIPNSIAILFPYLRSFVSTVTAQAGITPFILPTININKLLEEQNIQK